MSHVPIKVLLIEDDPDYAFLIREQLSESRSIDFDLECVDRLSQGLNRLSAGGIDVVLSDLSLPDSQGLDTFNKEHAAAPDVPIILLTGLEDEGLAIQAAQQGAQEYLVKSEVDTPLLVRTIRYAIERHRLIEELERVRQREQQERELDSLEQLSRPPQGTSTTQVLGSGRLSSNLPEAFTELVNTYAELLDLVLEGQAFKVEHNISGELRALGERIGKLQARPRDVVEIHSTALRRKVRQANTAKAQAYIEESRLLVLELMGYLASYYREKSFSPEAVHTPEANGR